MRRIPALLATLALTGLGVLVPTTGAQAASANCDAAWRDAKPGYFFAYQRTDCSGTLGAATGDDPNRGDASGSFQRTDNDSAESLLHRGTSGWAVKVFAEPGYVGPNACIAKSELYVSGLRNDFLRYATRVVNAANSISSHKWVPEKECTTFLQ